MEVVPDRGRELELDNIWRFLQAKPLCGSEIPKSDDVQQPSIMPKEGQIFHTTSIWFFPLGVNSSLKQAQK